MNGLRVELEAVYPDGCGAPAIVRFQGYVWAAHYVGEPRLYLITRCGRAPSARIIRHAYRAYESAVRKAAPEGWFKLNAAAYADAAQ